MEKSFKQYVDLATAWRSDQFFRARIKLTAWYVAIIVLILVFFSGALYANVNKQIYDSFREHIKSNEDLRQIFHQAATDLQIQLLTIDGIVLLLAIGASYIFAGYTLKPIKESVDAQKRFVASASHELRTPLAVMQTDIEVLVRQDASLSVQAKKTLKSMLEELAGMKEMANQMLSLSAAEHHQVSANKEDFDLSVAVAAIINKLSGIAAAKNINIKKTLAAPLIVHADMGQISHAISNVLDNAIKYTQAGGTVAVRLQRSGNFAEIEVADSGIGIKEQDLPHVFERFYKADQSHGSSGAGLGLSIVKTLVENEAGSIAITSKLGSGTTVTIKIPVKTETKPATPVKGLPDIHK